MLCSKWCDGMLCSNCRVGHGILGHVWRWAMSKWRRALHEELQEELRRMSAHTSVYLWLCLFIFLCLSLSLSLPLCNAKS